jgi:RNA polymerase sigma-70 factor (ECF subfamily)
LTAETTTQRRPRQGGSIDFKQIVMDHQERVMNTCYRFVHNREDAEDVAQDVFVEVHRSLNRFRGDARLSTWIYRIAVTKSLDFIRRKKRQKRFGRIIPIFGGEEDKDVQIAAKDIPDPETTLEQKERNQILKQAVESLSENQRVAVTLNKYEGFSYKEIAEIMDTSVASVESLIFRGMKNLKKKLTQYYGTHL